jgi:hypothetical protein
MSRTHRRRSHSPRVLGPDDRVRSRTSMSISWADSVTAHSVSLMSDGYRGTRVPVSAPVSRAASGSAGHRCAAGVQYLRLQLALITMGTDSVCLVVPSLAQKVMLNVEFC